MSGIQVTVPLQTIIRLMVAAQVCQNVTLPSIQKPALATTTEAPVLPSGYVAFPEYGLAYKHFDTRVSFNDAISRCSSENGQLAVIDSWEKVDKMFNIFGNLIPAWIGIHRLEDTERWITVDGKSRSSLPWGSGEPRGDYRCVYLWKVWNGICKNDCRHKFQYFCEITWPKN